MQVLHVISGLDPTLGGPVSALKGLGSALLQVGVDLEVMACWRHGDNWRVAEHLRSQGATVTAIGPVCGPTEWHPSLKRTVQKRVAEADVVHIHGLWEEIQHQAARACRRLNKPYIFRPCGMLDPWSLRQKALKKRLYMALRLRRDLEHASALHFTAEQERALTDPLRLSPPAIVEPNGIDLSEFGQSIDPTPLWRRYPALRDQSVVLFLGRLHAKKGLDLLIPAFAQLPADTVLVLAGPVDDDFRAYLDKLIQQVNIGDRVVFTGMLEGAERLMAFASADLFVLPSYQENFGIAVVEALAYGVPVIISDQVNIYQEITEAGVGAVTDKCPEALAQTLAVWLNDDDRRTQAAARAQPFVEHRYDWQTIAKHWRDHYQKLQQMSFPRTC